MTGPVVGGACGRRGMLVSALVALACALTLGAALVGAPVALADNGQTSLSIVLPQPSGNLAQGPVGAYVSITGIGTANEPYNLGYAAQSAGCQSGFTAFSNPNSVRAAQDGSFSATVVWPPVTSPGDTRYVICAQDANNASAPPIQSTDAYRVVASSAPAITVQPADISTPTPDAAPTPTPKPGHLFAGSGALISGSNFAPAGTPVQFYLSISSRVTKQTLAVAQKLSPINNGQITSDPSGSFSATVVLPNNQTGTFFIVAVSTDQTGDFPPSLQAVAQVVLQIAPQVTPTPTPSPSPTITATPKGGGSAGGSTGTTTGSSPNQPAVFALGGLSIILFVVGVMLLASTVAGPRPRSPQPY